MNRPRSLTVTLALLSCVAAGLPGQRGGGRRGPPPEVRERWGNYFTTVQLEKSQDEKVDLLAGSGHVTTAAKDGHMSLLYLFDSADEPKKREGFEQALFNHNKIQPGLRLFRCGMVDITSDDTAKQKYGSLAPVFVVFDEKGKETGAISMKGYHAVPVKLVQLLRKGAAGYSKMSFDGWVKSYGGFVQEITQLKAKENLAQSQRARIEEKGEKADKGQLQKAGKKYDAALKATEQHLAKEAVLLELAKVPPRDAAAKLVGEPARGRGR